MHPSTSFKPNGAPPVPGVIAAAELAAKLNAKSTGENKWQALCPAHADKKPSLSITEDGGKLLLHCFAGCEFQSILRAAESYDVYAQPNEVLDIDELRRHAALRFPGNSSKGIGNITPQIVARYHYTNAKGELLYEVVRYAPKDFRQRRPDGIGGWIWNLKRIDTVLYRLPKVLKAKQVYIVEGEKDVAALEKFGHTATTNSGGAGKWKPEYSKCLKGKRVIIIPDTDEPGRKHADAVARSLSEAGVDWIKVVELSGAKDITDWVKAGGSKQSLAELVRAAPRYKTPLVKGIRCYDDIPLLADCIAAGAAIDYIEKPILVAGAITALTGDAGCGKSTLATALANRAHKAGRPVLLLDRENPTSVIADRFARLKVTDGATFRIWGGWVGTEVPQPGEPLIVDWIRSCEPRPLVVIDSMSAFHGGDENSASDTRAFLQQARSLADAGATVIVLHHDGKATGAKDYRGSSDFKAAVDIAFHVSNTTDDGRLSRLTLRCFKSRFGFAGNLVYDYNGGRMEQRATEVAKPEDEQLVELLTSNPGIKMPAFEKLALSMGLGRNRSRRFLTQGVRAGTIRYKSGPNNEKKYWAKDDLAS